MSTDPQAPRPTGRPQNAKKVSHPWTRFGLIVSPVLLAASLYLAISQALFQAHAAPATATIVSSSRGPTHSRGECVHHQGYTYYPVIRFTTQDGRRVVTWLTARSSCTPPADGTVVKIDYDPRDPTKVQPAGWWHAWGIPVVGIPLGGFFTALSVAAFLRHRRKDRERQDRAGGWPSSSV